MTPVEDELTILSIS